MSLPRVSAHVFWLALVPAGLDCPRRLTVQQAQKQWPSRTARRTIACHGFHGDQRRRSKLLLEPPSAHAKYGGRFFHTSKPLTCGDARATFIRSAPPVPRRDCSPREHTACAHWANVREGSCQSDKLINKATGGLPRTFFLGPLLVPRPVQRSHVTG